MKLKEWNIASSNPSANSFRVLPFHTLEKFLEANFDERGFLKSDEIRPVLVYQDEDGKYQYQPIKRIVSGYVQTEDSKLYKLKGLAKYTRKFKFLDARLVLNQSNPYEQQKIQCFSVTGKSHAVNEDSYLGITHPKNPELKLLVVADGMGGLEAGEVASRFLVDKLTAWFIREDPNNLDNLRYINDNLIDIIRSISVEMYQEFAIKKGIESGSTLAMAIINSSHTVIANVGDSRIGIVDDDGLRIVSIDDSPLVSNYRPPTPKEQDLMRVMPGNNCITRYMGALIVKPHIRTLENEDYKDIFLFSDGITDCMNYSTLNHIACNIDKETLLKFITEASYGPNDNGTKSKASDDETVVHYSKR